VEGRLELPDVEGGIVCNGGRTTDELEEVRDDLLDRTGLTEESPVRDAVLPEGPLRDDPRCEGCARLDSDTRVDEGVEPLEDIPSLVELDTGDLDDPVGLTEPGGLGVPGYPGLFDRGTAPLSEESLNEGGKGQRASPLSLLRELRVDDVVRSHAVAGDGDLLVSHDGVGVSRQFAEGTTEFSPQFCGSLRDIVGIALLQSSGSLVSLLPVSNHHLDDLVLPRLETELQVDEGFDLPLVDDIALSIDIGVGVTDELCEVGLRKIGVDPVEKEFELGQLLDEEALGEDTRVDVVFLDELHYPFAEEVRLHEAGAAEGELPHLIEGTGLPEGAVLLADEWDGGCGASREVGELPPDEIGLGRGEAHVGVVGRVLQELEVLLLRELRESRLIRDWDWKILSCHFSSSSISSRISPSSRRRPLISS